MNLYKKTYNYIVLDWKAQTRKRNVLFFRVTTIDMLRIPNYAIASHTKDSQQHRNWPLFLSVPADAVQIQQQHVRSQYEAIAPLSFSVSVVIVAALSFVLSVISMIIFVSFHVEGEQFWRHNLGK